MYMNDVLLPADSPFGASSGAAISHQSLPELLATGNLNAWFQPVLHLTSGTIVGYEGLIRGPTDSPLHTPTRLFAEAENLGLVAEAEIATHLIVIRRFAELALPGRLFLNVSPASLTHPDLRNGQTAKMLANAGLSPQQVVMFVEAARAVCQIRPKARVVLVGDGPEAAALRAANPDFVFAGTRMGQDLAAHYASADLFLFPSTTETFGNVTTEALASSLAVAAYDYAAAHEYIVDGESGLLAPLGDPESFLAAARILARSPQTVGRLRLNAVAVGRRLGWDAVVDDLERVFQGVVGAEPTQRAAHTHAAAI